MNIMTFVILLLVAAVAGLAWVLLMQRQRVLSADGPIIDQGGGPLDLAIMTVERLTASRTPTQEEDIMDARTTNAATASANDGSQSFFDHGEADNLRHQWDAIQASFVDEPRKAVEEADRLVADAVKRLSESFASERRSLTGSSEVSTEDLRLALKRYKSYFSRLLAI
jgi:hypothetical protein